MRTLTNLAPGSLVAMTFMLPLELAAPDDRPALEAAARGAAASGTPWISFFDPEEIVSMATAAGFTHARYVPTEDIAARYLRGRPDGLQAASGEGLLLARR